MNTKTKTLLASTLAVLVVVASTAAWAQQAPKPEQLIKWRQSAFQVIAWNSGRIKTSIEGTYNRDEVIKAANTIAAIANGSLGSLFAPGTDTGKGWHDTAVKPALFSDGAKAGEAAASFSKEATELANVALTGDVVAVKGQYAKLTRTCKSCHDDYRAVQN